MRIWKIKIKRKRKRNLIKTREGNIKTKTNNRTVYLNFSKRRKEIYNSINTTKLN